jgi:hypothetical protein
VEKIMLSNTFGIPSGQYKEFYICNEPFEGRVAVSMWVLPSDTLISSHPREVPGAIEVWGLDDKKGWYGWKTTVGVPKGTLDRLIQYIEPYVNAHLQR